MASVQFKARPGDLIAIDRGIYTHWAVYIGKDEVVHLTNSDDSGSSNVLMSIVTEKALVRRQKIWEVTGGDEFRVNNFMDDEYEPRDPHFIVKKACEMVGRQLEYSAVSQNCEHFVTWLRYGKKKSQQVETVTTVAGVAAVGLVAVGLAALFSNSSNKTKNQRRHYK